MSTLVSGAVTSRSEQRVPVRVWRHLYEEAMLETDSGRVKDRIATAEEAIIQRSRELARMRQLNDEDAELTSAILSLCDLKRKLDRRRS